jgi:hypothetical protein
MPNKVFTSAKVKQNDEFYTRMEDISVELFRYRDFFKGKTILCNCDDPDWSNFWIYFVKNFDWFGLRKLISTHYEPSGRSYKLEIAKDENGNGSINEKDTIKTPLSGNGDFRSDECVALLKEADIVITNPPFSLFREYVAQLMQYGKKFIIIGSQNAITYKEIFPLIKDDKLWLGYNKPAPKIFRVPDGFSNTSTFVKDGKTYAQFGNTLWFTNLDVEKRHENTILVKEYENHEDEYPHFDNYDAINVNKTDDIPKDYFGAMGVPITFLGKYNPEQFEIIDALNRYALLDAQGTNEAVAKKRSHTCNIDGKPTYFRIVIRRKQK